MNTKITTTASVLLRILLGWFMFFAGIEKVLDPAWSASGFLSNAKTFPSFYAWFGDPSNSWWIDPMNAWGIMLIGIALLLGIAIRPAALFGALLMILYYFPQNVFPSVPHGFIVEYHFIYATAFILIAFFAPARKFGLGRKLQNTSLGRLPIIKSLM